MVSHVRTYNLGFPEAGDGIQEWSKVKVLLHGIKEGSIRQIKATKLNKLREADVQLAMIYVQDYCPEDERPYRYAIHQKNEIDKIVQEMLTAGTIQASSSSYASPVVLVKEKDGSWRLCVDYRGLNNMTVNDRFPIPLIEDLMDELGGSVICYKIDLRAGYQQVRMDPCDIHKTAFKHMVDIMNISSCLSGLLMPLLHFKRKCIFATEWVEYLGHYIEAKGISTDPSKVKAVNEWPVPKNIKQLRGFLGLAGYYRRFVRRFGTIARPLTALTKKDSFSWSPEGHFVIKTDQRSLKYLLEQRLNTPIQQQWLPKLLEFDYEIQYKQGKENLVADALSRMEGAEILNMAMSVLECDFLQQIQAGYDSDLELKELIDELKVKPQARKHYSWTQNILRRKSKIVVPHTPLLRGKILDWLHSSGSGGHSGRVMIGFVCGVKDMK
ncbi:unnamed protein product [Microthlaspi erraticum]|uniref:Reverse transcriptase domain-containing protein n=1 Tax=Microthlaspi erraticum TaxID=1685480 RepID=A0A6D2KAN2_9BRAS|nr:unnamed protein product [Microthlaspi erraticum]